MASRRVVALWLFLSLVGPAMADPHFPEYHPISEFDNGEVQFVGKLAVEIYNKKGESHLYFIEVVNGTVVDLTNMVGNSRKIWELEVKASNCSQPGSVPALYRAVAYENMFREWDQTEAYGSNFTSLGDISPISN